MPAGSRELALCACSFRTAFTTMSGFARGTSWPLPAAITNSEFGESRKYCRLKLVPTHLSG